MFEPERFAVAEQTQEVAGRIAACNDHDVVNTRIHESLNRVIDHRLVENRQQMFVCDGGQRTQSRPQATR